MKRSFLIVAGGSGKRMLSGIPKQFLLLAGKPILMRTLDIFYRVDPSASIVLVIPSAHFNRWKGLCEDYHFQIPHKLVAGGNSRFESVAHGLAQIDENCLVAIHDGVRPLVTTKLIKKALETAEKSGNAVPGVTLQESIRKVEDGKNIPVNRDDYVIIQTPQVFLASEIKKAYNQEYKPSFTDDASVLESTGKVIHLIEGEVANIKITNIIHLDIAETILSKRI